MLKTVAAKIAWVGRPASMVFGLALVMALSSCGSGSQETKKPANSTPNIAFMKEDSDGFWQTWVANKDLSDQVQLTSGSAGRSGSPGVPNSPSSPITPIPIPRTQRRSTTSSR